MIKTLLNKGFLTQAFEVLRKRTASYPGEGFGDRLDALQAEFKYMSDFMMQGYKDEKRTMLYENLLQRAEELDYDLSVRETLLENPYIKSAIKVLGTRNDSTETLQGMLRDNTDEETHFKNLAIVFMALLTSGHWRKHDSDEWCDYITSHDTDTVDSSTLTSAITLSSICHFSYYKTQCLANIYITSDDTSVRQRAFTGFMFAVSGADEQYRTQVNELLNMVFSAKDTGKDIIEMQIQMSACANAESDCKEINKSIMPELMRNHPFRFTKDGFIEKEEEKDCIDLDADERKMNTMADGVNKMLQMQKNGSDIFFSGFSQMKRFPFFSRISNWFTPFTTRHPELKKGANIMQDNGFIEKMTQNGPFCNSDKYSFVIAMSDILPNMPENIRKMMEEGEIGPLGMQITQNKAITPSMVRMHYLQDMYRFFKINNAGTSMPTPFAHVAQYQLWTVAKEHFTDAERKTMFNSILRDERIWDITEKIQQPSNGATAIGIHPAKQLLDSFQNKESFEYLSCHAVYMMKLNNYKEAAETYTRCLNIKPEDPSLMRGMARACYSDGEYAKAAFYFDALHTLFPKRLSYVLNYAMAMVMDGAAQSVVNDMYKLEYENPDNISIKNTLGWVLLHARKAEQALDLYEKMLQTDCTEKDFSLLLNAFYAYLANGKVQQGVDLIKKHYNSLEEQQQKEFPEMLEKTMRDDAMLLDLYYIGKAEKSIILSQFAFFMV